MAVHVNSFVAGVSNRVEGAFKALDKMVDDFFILSNNDSIIIHNVEDTFYPGAPANPADPAGSAYTNGVFVRVIVWEKINPKTATEPSRDTLY